VTAAPDDDAVLARYLRDCERQGIEPHKPPAAALHVLADVLARDQERRRQSRRAAQPPEQAS
jgi:hypothetical protein